MNKILFQCSGTSQINLIMRDEGVVFNFYAFDSNSRESDVYSSLPFPISLFKEGIKELKTRRF